MNWLKSLIGLLLLPFLGVVFPELGDPGEIMYSAGNLAGLAGISAIIVEGIKRMTGYDSDVNWKFIPQLYTLIVSALLAVIFWWQGWGILIELETLLQTIIFGVITAGLSMGYYDVPTVKKWLKILWNIELDKKLR